DRHRRARAIATRQQRTVETPELPETDTIELWDAACETDRLHGSDASEPLLRKLLDLRPDHAGARVVLGRSLLNRSDAEGEELLWGVVDRRDERWTLPACEVLSQHYLSTGRTEKLREVRTRQDGFDEATRAAQRERSSVKAGDPLVPHA